MKKPFRIIIFLVLVLSPMVFAGYSRPQAPQVNSNDVTQALISEIHGLRQALQSYTVDNHRAQFVVERLRLQQSRVDKIEEELENVRLQVEQSVLTLQQA